MDLTCRQCGLPINDVHNAVINHDGILHCSCGKGIPLWWVLIEYSLRTVTQDVLEEWFCEVMADDTIAKRVVALFQS